MSKIKIKEAICLICNNHFNKRSNKDVKYCSKDCYYKSRQSKTLVKCAACEKEFYKKPSSLKQSRSGLFFCTRDCKDKSQRIGGIEEIMPDHYKKYDILNSNLPIVENSICKTHPEIAKQWHPTLNGNLTPFNFTSGSNYKAFWKCVCGYECQSRINNFIKNKCICSTVKHNLTEKDNSIKVIKNKRIYYPSVKHNLIEKDNSLGMLNPELAKEWHPTKNGNLTPFDVINGGHTKYWWKCEAADDHEWKSTVSNRKQKNTNCPCCSNKKLVKSNSLAVANPELAKEWHPIKNGNLTSFDVINGGNTKHWWICSGNINHEWQASICRRNQGFGCPKCRLSWGEKRVAKYLEKNDIVYTPQFVFENMKRRLRYDFGIFNKRVCVIEYNGQQHYYPMNFGSKKEGYDLRKLQGNQERDQIKIDYCRENNIELLIIPYWDFDRIEEILTAWFNNEEAVFSKEPEIVKKYKIGVFNE